MEKYLQLLLKEVNTVIIPGLGALTITNYKTGEIMFMPYLKYDDGKLSSFIKDKAEISEEDAKSLISVKVESILSNLNNGSNASLSGLGFFSKDSSGDVIFSNNSIESENKPEELEASFSEDTLIDEIIVVEPEIVDSFLESTPVSIPVDIVSGSSIDSDVDKKEDVSVEKKKSLFGIFNKAAIDKEVINEIENNEEIKNNQAFQVADSVVIVENDIVETVIEEENIIQDDDEQKEVIVESLTEESLLNTIIPEDNINLESEGESVKESDLEDVFPESDQDDDVVVKKKKGIGFFVKIFLLLLVVGSGVLVGINFKNVQDHIPFLSHKKEVSDEQKMISKLESDKTKPSVNDGVKSEELIETPEEVHVEPKSNTISNDDKSRSNHLSSKVSTSLNEPLDVKQTFYIVLGSFSNKSNADRSVSKLISEGKNSAITVERNGKFLVTISNYSNIDDANSGLKSVKETFSKAWILKP